MITEDNVVMLLGIIMDRMGVDSITITKQDIVSFEGNIDSHVDAITDSCTITRIK